MNYNSIMKINIIAVGKLQNDFKVLFDSYAKKLNFWATLNVIELKEVNHENIEVQKEKETAEILKNVPKGSRVILCSLKGKQYDSVSFSSFFDMDNLTFVIGGSHGVDESQFNEKINFSKMTFPHQMFRVMLIEQIYRGLAIKNNSKYHK